MPFPCLPVFHQHVSRAHDGIVMHIPVESDRERALSCPPEGMFFRRAAVELTWTSERYDDKQQPRDATRSLYGCVFLDHFSDSSLSIEGHPNGEMKRLSIEFRCLRDYLAC